MELKQYQQDTLNDLAAFMEQLQIDKDLNKAYNNFWRGKGISLATIEATQFLHPYDNSIKGVPRVMFKVPTAGGKTFIACNALKVLFDHLPAEQHKVVAWFVPSDSILKQTYANLSNPTHPYRQRINTHFGNRVVVVNKETALSGTDIQPGQISEQLTIFVLSVQSFAANNKDGRRVYRENSSLASYAEKVNDDNRINSQKKSEEIDETSLIQAIATLNPVVIIDESHNFSSDLRIELFNEINPSFILDLTATPRQNSNIISFVDAKKLKDANMVKLPVVLYNRDSTNDVIVDAIQLQRKLEQLATEQYQNGGHYIRPIVLFQAQPKTDSDNETFDKVKDNLVKIGIPEEQIKIKTANIDELKNINLMSEECPVRYIITVNALKEGWDCPFAYILASLANKTSSVDVEQILGRVLRLPYTTKHASEYLNLSYVFTSSNNFRETIEKVIKSLNNAGFSPKDYRLANPTETTQVTTTSSSEGLFSTSTTPEDQPTPQESAEDQDDIFNPETIKTKLTKADSTESDDTTTDSILEQAHNANETYEQENNDKPDTDIPSDIADKIKTYRIKECFKAACENIKLPIFVKKVENSSNIFYESEYQPLTKTLLTEEFELEKADKNINFMRSEQEAVRIDLEERNKGEYVPKQYSMSNKALHLIRELFVSYNIEDKRNQLIAKIAKRLHFDEINEPHISNYIRDVLEGKSNEELVDLFDNELRTEETFKVKIDSLLEDHQKQMFKKALDVGAVRCESQYVLPQQITLGKPVLGLSKGLYTEEGDMNDFEYHVISSIANCNNVMFWHRNPERGKGFCINGFINHYPDFIVLTTNGKIILVETKGDDRDNSDSRNKLELGKTWANKAGDDYRYFMVFDKKELDGAYTIAEFLTIMKEL